MSIETIIILIFSALFGFTLKMADLLDEHHLKLFKGAPLFFGVLWGSIGSFFILTNSTLASFFIAILLHWILRCRIDYLNHGVAASIMLVVFFYNLPNFSMDWILFSTIFVGYSIFGFLNDTSDRGEIGGRFGQFFKLNSHLIIIPLLLTLFNTAYLIIAASSILQIIFYSYTAKVGMMIIEKQRY